MIFKSRIALRLGFYFAGALLVFAVTIGSVFLLLFREHTLRLFNADIESRALLIASTLSSYMNGEEGEPGQGKRKGYGAYMRFIGDIAGTDVWIIDKDLHLITSGAKPAGTKRVISSYSELPEDAGKIINEVFTGVTVHSRGFSDVLKELTLTVAVPIKGSTGEVVGVVLLHSPVHGIEAAVSRGFLILGISMALALLLSFAFSAVCAVSFTKPINRMKSMAVRLIDGDYTARTGIVQKDEIGELAETFDILSQRLDIAKGESARLEEIRREFVANISHELRTPVTVLVGSLRAIVDGVVSDPEMIRSYHEQMLKEAGFLQRLVGDLIDLSRLQHADFVIENSEFCAGDVMDDAARSAGRLAAPKGVVIRTTKDEPERRITGDYGRFRQMLMIVLDNAVKFSGDSGTVEFELKEDRITVRDHGNGISEEDMPHIFERFYRSRTEQNKAGTGLGLAIARRIAERHGIEMSANSTPGEGAEFSFKL